MKVTCDRNLRHYIDGAEIDSVELFRRRGARGKWIKVWSGRAQECWLAAFSVGAAINGFEFAAKCLLGDRFEVVPFRDILHAEEV